MASVLTPVYIVLSIALLAFLITSEFLRRRFHPSISLNIRLRVPPLVGAAGARDHIFQRLSSNFARENMSPESLILLRSSEYKKTSK